MNTGHKRHIFREAVRDMKAIDAVEYLLDALEEVLCEGGHKHEVDEWAHWTPMERRLLIALVENPGTCTKDQLMRRMYAASGDEPDSVNILSVTVAKLRKKLHPEFGRILVVWGVGYRFERPPNRAGLSAATRKETVRPAPNTR